MSFRSTPTLAICLAGGLAAGIALARPATTSPSPIVDAAPGVEQPVADLPTMNIADFTFSTVDAVAGATVTVTNADAAAHTATSSDGIFDTGNLAGGTTGTFTAPAVPGIYPLFCAIHPSMQGQLVVT